ncbi:hypothetical protein [Pseudoalteromonas sp. T1lg10]|uniref:hypothetical protein n=1 Tax=Pseudoalteromonas sp. T1lg10 TaxID=2077093 RepID=UPI000CF74ED3|nr:hypothetical protein [Pseudoalteromonas sp. T1lg10]
MDKKLIASVVLNLVLVAVLLKGTFEPKDQKVFIATKDQVACLENWKKKTYAKQQIWEPEYFDEHYVVFDDSVEGARSFESEISGCFYDATTGTDQLQELEPLVKLLESEGYKNISFYKPPQDSRITVYGK